MGLSRPGEEPKLQFASEWGNPNQHVKLQCFSAPVETVQTSSGPQQQIIRLGNAGRNELSGPGLSNLDFSLVNNSKVAGLESGSIQFRAEFFNILNKSNFAPPLGTNTIFDQDGSAADGAGWETRHKRHRDRYSSG